jgi:adenylate cyclase class IV
MRRLASLRRDAPTVPRCLEVERKFTATPGLLSSLQRTDPCARKKTIIDTYYDVPVTWPLTTQDNWLRMRSGAWELKSPHAVAPNAIRLDRYVELTNERDIYECICALLERASPTSLLTRLSARDTIHAWRSGSNCSFADVLNGLGIRPFANITTTRTRYELGDGLGVDIDDVEFGSACGGGHYALAEVEVVIPLSGTNAGDSAAAGVSVAEEAALRAAEAAIARFVELYALPLTPVRGKVLECIARSDLEHYAALERAGLLAVKLGG